MKSFSAFIIVLTIGLVIGSCIGTKQITGPEPSSADTKFYIFVNQQPVKGAIVRFGGYEGKTSEKGMCYFPIPRGKIGKEGQVFILHEGFKIDTSLQLFITKPTSIYLQSSTGNLDILNGKVRSEMDKKDEIEDLISEAGKMLAGIEQKIHAYMKEHPGSEVDIFNEILKERKGELSNLKKMVVDITGRFEKVIKALKNDEIVNFGEHEKMMSTLENSLDLFMEKTNKTSWSLDNIIAAQPDATISMDIFFLAGEYKLTNLTPSQKDSLEVYYRKIIELKNGSYMNREINQLYVGFSAIGSADGVRVSNKLNQEITPLCTGEFDFANPNRCLSYLRAKGLAEYIEIQIAQFKPVIKIDGIGDSLANGSTASNPTLRKCQLSFVVVPVEILPGNLQRSNQLIGETN